MPLGDGEVMRMHTPPHPSVIYIHRGRNMKSREIGRLFTSKDYNFDYRGTNPMLLLAKAKITATEIPKADIYLVEGGLCLNVAHFVKKQKAKHAKIILMVPEPLFYLDHVSGPKRRYLRHIMESVDGVIAVSEQVGHDARQLYHGKVEIAHYYADNLDVYSKNKPNLRKHSIVFVCERPHETGRIKGLAIALDAFKLIKEKIPDAEFSLIGSGTEHFHSSIPGVKGLGFLPLEKMYAGHSIIISPAHYDAFPLAIVEACVAGLIPVVSKRTGSSEFILPIDPSLVVHSLKPQEYADRVIDIWNRPLPSVQKLSKELKKKGLTYTKENTHKEFTTAWQRLLNHQN